MRVLLWIGWLGWVLSIAAQPVSGVVEHPSAAFCALQEDLERILEYPELTPGFVGAFVQSLQTGEVVVERNGAKPFVPASLLKLFTTAAALDFLGADYRFRTVLLTDGFITQDSILRGNLILWSNGNPALSPVFHLRADSLFGRLAEALYERGVRVIEGDLIADDSYFDREFWAPGWDVEDLAYSYAAPVSALAVQDNCVQVDLVPSPNGTEGFRIVKRPNYPFVTLQVDLLPVDSGSTEVQLQRDPCSATYRISGTVLQDTVAADTLTFWLPVDDPALFAAFCLRQSLRQHKIRLRGDLRRSGGASSSSNRQMETLVEWFSPPLSKIIAGINQHSYNLGAEMLLKALGKIFRGEGTRNAGIDAVLGFLRFAHIDVEHLRIVDGSGLSRLNLLTPQQIAQLLAFLYRRKYRSVFLQSLAQPGAPGTLESRMVGTDAQGAVFAKTGTLTGVSAIGGYCFSRDREPFVFVLIVNNAPFSAAVARSIQDLFILRLVNFSRH